VVLLLAKLEVLAYLLGPELLYGDVTASHSGSFGLSDVEEGIVFCVHVQSVIRVFTKLGFLRQVESLTVNLGFEQVEWLPLFDTGIHEVCSIVMTNVPKSGSQLFLLHRIMLVGENIIFGRCN
jgi:hypothetical protein